MIGNRRASPLLRVWVPRFAGALARGIFDGILSSVVEFWDEESLGSLDSGGPALEHSGSAVCLARSFVRQWEPCSAWFSCSVVVLGPSHTSYLVNRCAGSIHRKLVGKANSCAFVRERGSYHPLLLRVLGDARVSGPGRMERAGGCTALAKAFRQDLLWSWVVYWVIFGVIQTFRYYEHYRASDRRLEKMDRSLSQACPSSAKSEAC